MEAQRAGSVDFWEAPDCAALSPEVISRHILFPLGLSVGLYSAAASSAAPLGLSWCCLGRVQGCSLVPGVPDTSWSPSCHGTGRSWCLGMVQGTGMLRMRRQELLALPGGALLIGGAQRCPRKDTENFPHRGKRNPWQLLQPPRLPAASSEQLPLPARGFTAPCSPEGLFIGGFIFAFPHPHVFLPAQSCYSRPLISRQRSPPPNPAARVQLPDVETSSQPRGN